MATYAVHVALLNLDGSILCLLKEMLFELTDEHLAGNIDWWEGYSQNEPENYLRCHLFHNSPLYNGLYYLINDTSTFVFKTQVEDTTI